MPIEMPSQIQPQDSLPTGRVKINANFELFRVFVNALESGTPVSITPEDIDGLLVDGKIDPVYLDTYLSSVSASDVSVLDSGSNYIGTDVESVLAEIFSLIEGVTVGSGSRWYADTGVPDGSLGSSGDFYLRIVDGTFYEKTGPSTWSLLGSLKGADGDTGATGATGAAGVGVPVGGTTGQFLAKASSTDYDTEWVNEPVGVGGGLDGPVSSTNNGVALWDGVGGDTLKDGPVLGTAALSDAVDFATAAQGILASTAVQPGSLGGAASLNVGTTAGTVAAGNDSRITSAVPNTRTVSAGTGLTGGGALSANISLALSSGTQGSIALADTSVQPDRTIGTQHSLTGGGTLSTNRTLSLVNDVASPGNNKVYGTDGSGVRVWKDDPAGGVTTEIVDVADGTSFTVLSSHNNDTLWINQTQDIEFILPDNVGEDFQCGVVGYTSNDITFSTTGTGSLSPSGYSITGTAGVPIALALVFRDSVWTVVGPTYEGNLSVNEQSGASYTYVLSDGDGKTAVNFTNSSPVTATIPTNASVAYPTGTVLANIQSGSGLVTTVGATGVTVNGVTPGNITSSGQYKTWSFTKVGTNTWVASGGIE